MRAPRVVTAGGDAGTRLGIRMVLEQDGIVVVGEADSGEELLDLTLSERPDACLVDLRVAGSLAATRTISRDAPATRIIVMTASGRTEDLLTAVRAGASGYLLKSMDTRRMAQAVRGVLGGEAAIPRALVPQLLEAIRSQERHPAVPLSAEQRKGLTTREWQVLNLLADELPTREIAERLGISAVTVRRHVSDILRKLGVGDRQAALNEMRRRREQRPPPAAGSR